MTLLLLLTGTLNTTPPSLADRGREREREGESHTRATCTEAVCVCGGGRWKNRWQVARRSGSEDGLLN